MTPSEACERINELGKRISNHAFDIDRDMEMVKQQWRGLITAGGARDDHAATILAKQVAPSLQELHDFLDRVLIQIEEWKTNPFGDA